MLWVKNKYILTVSGGTVSGNTDFMKGKIEQLIISPITETTQWDMTLTDRDGDVIYKRVSETGTLNDRTAMLPIGRDSSERFTIGFLNVTANENIKVIFKVLEKF